jgi:hypothetical protein
MRQLCEQTQVTVIAEIRKINAIMHGKAPNSVMGCRMRELSSAPQGHLFELLGPPGAQRRGEQIILQFLHNSTPLKSSQGLYTATGSLVCGRSLGP